MSFATPFYTSPQMETQDKMKEILKIFQNVAIGLNKGRSECVYQKAVASELQSRHIQYTEEETIPIYYNDRVVGQERLDIILNTWFELIIELKATVCDIKPENIWQLISYMKHKSYSHGVVVNFNQSPHKPISYSFVIMQEGIPQLYNVETATYTQIIDAGF